MISEKAKALLLQAVKEELLNAEKMFPKHNSAHESYAILREEFEELKEADQSVCVYLENYLWKNIKCNDKNEMIISLENLKEWSLAVIEEAIQFSAMCDRFKKDVLS